MGGGGHWCEDSSQSATGFSFISLANQDKRHVVLAGSDAADANWFDMNDLPKLAFDHDAIIATAHQWLTAKLEYSIIALQFMVDEFMQRRFAPACGSLQGDRPEQDSRIKVRGKI